MRPMNWQTLKRQIADALLWLFAAILLFWIGDWAVWRIRVHLGGGYDTVQVSQILLTPLKNHRMNADPQSTTDQPCTRSIFPHAGADPCWWLRRHATDWQSASSNLPAPTGPVPAWKESCLRPATHRQSS